MVVQVMSKIQDLKGGIRVWIEHHKEQFMQTQPNVNITKEQNNCVLPKISQHINQLSFHHPNALRIANGNIW